MNQPTCDQCERALTKLEQDFAFTTCLNCAEQRIDTIGVNGNNGDHYATTTDTDNTGEQS